MEFDSEYNNLSYFTHSLLSTGFVIQVYPTSLQQQGFIRQLICKVQHETCIYIL